MNVCLGKHTYVETMGLYVCLGKHTYLETRGMYVCQRYGETYIHTQKLEVCMYVKGMYIWVNIPPWKMKGMYVCLGKHTYLETRGMYVCQRYLYLGNIQTWKMIGMYVCLRKHTYRLGVCLGTHTYPENGMYVCLGSWGTHTDLENDRYVCMSGETYIPRKL